MHIQIINFHLKDMTEQEYEALCDQVAPAFVTLPGLVSKVWLADPASNTFGGVYTWESREAMFAFTETELFKAVATHPNLDEITSRDFAVMEAQTALTRGLPVAAASVAV